MRDPRLTDLDGLVARVEALVDASEHPVVVGISGVGGAGKSTLARAVVARVPGAVRLRGDDLLSPIGSRERSSDWSAVDRSRLVRDVLAPFREGRASTFQRWDWATGELAPPEPAPTGRVLVVDLVGLLHPDVLPVLDLSVWCDVDPAVATTRGIVRDRAAGDDHDALWHEVWAPNDADFAIRFRPRDVADVLVDTA